MTKYCKKYDKTYSDSHKFCNDCGGKLVEKVEIQKTHEGQHHINKKHIFIATALIILLASAVVIFAIPIPYTATEIYSETEPYTATETYTEKEPYTTTETYQDTEQYTDKQCANVDLVKNYKWGQTSRNCKDYTCDSYQSVCVETNWLGNCVRFQDVCQSSSCSNYEDTCNLVVKNLDTVNGIFSFDGYYKTKDGAMHLVQKLSKSLQPQEEYSFTWTYAVSASNIGTCQIQSFVTPKKTQCDNVIKSRTVDKTRPVTAYRDVTKTRSVTKYQDAEKSRSVTKYATLFQRWTGKVEYEYRV